MFYCPTDVLPRTFCNPQINVKNIQYSLEEKKFQMAIEFWFPAVS